MPSKIPVVAIASGLEPATGRIVVRFRYFQSLTAAGAAPVLMPLGASPEAVGEILSRVDGLVISGGEDVDPKEYGEKKKPLCGEPSPLRDEAEKAQVAWCLAHDLPVLAICRGMQSLNVFAGGTLVQDIASELHTAVWHSQPQDHTVITHRVKALDAPLFASITGVSEIGVNSKHHQCIARPGRGVRVIAECPDDHVPEAFVIEGQRFALGIQWHPEMLAAEHPEHMAIFKSFVAACRGERKL